MPQRTVITCLHSFCVNVDRLAAARDKAPKIIGILLVGACATMQSWLSRWIQENTGGLSHRYCPCSVGLPGHRRGMGWYLFWKA